MYNRDTQILVDIEIQGKRNWVRITCTDGEVFEAYPDCITETEFEGNEDAVAMLFWKRDGKGYVVAGAQIKCFEILEPREKK